MVEPRGATDLLRDPSDGAGVGHLVGSESEVGGGHDGDGGGAEAGTSHDEAEAEEQLVGVNAYLGEGDRSGHGERDAGDRGSTAVVGATVHGFNVGYWGAQAYSGRAPSSAVP